MGFWCAETNAAPDPTQAYPGQVMRNYAMLLMDGGFMRGSLVLGCRDRRVLYLAVMLPFVLMEKIGLTPTQFGLVMLAQASFYALGAAVTGRLLRRIKVMRLVPIGLMLIAVAAIGFGIGLRLLPLSLYTAMGPVVIWAFGSALVIPGATTAALAGFPKVAGAASALAGFLQIGVGLAGTAVAALLFSDPLTALETVMPGMALLAMLAHFVLPFKARKQTVRCRPGGTGNSGRSSGSSRRWRRGDRKGGAPGQSIRRASY